jgi:ABC-2 type transport system permease protein
VSEVSLEKSNEPRRSSLVQLALMRARLFYREPAAMFWTFGFPMLLSVALGIAFRNQKPQPVRVAIESGPYAGRIAALLSPRTDVYANTLTDNDAREALRTGKVSVVVDEIDGRYTYRFDVTRPDSRLARLVVDDAIERGEGRADKIVSTDELVTESGSRYIDFLIPGLVGIGLMSSGLWGVGYALTDMRAKKLLKRLVATPMKKGEFLFSFLLVRAAFVVIEVPPLLIFGWLVFDVRVHGSMMLVGLTTILGAFTFAGLGLLVGSRTSSSEVVQGLINFVSLPMYMCSGVFFSADKFPDWSQPIVRALPLTALNDALRKTITDGAGLTDIATQIAIVAAWGVAAFAIALKLFRWR